MGFFLKFESYFPLLIVFLAGTFFGMWFLLFPTFLYSAMSVMQWEPNYFGAIFTFFVGLLQPVILFFLGLYFYRKLLEKQVVK